MLYNLLYPLRDIWIGFNVFKYITFRSAMAAITAFLLSIVFGPYVVRGLRHLKIREQVRKSDDIKALDKFHQEKEGTPTMGGVLILVAIVLSTILWADITNRFIWLSLGCTIGMGIIGIIDDSLKLLKRRSMGLRPMVKLRCQLIIAISLAVYLYLDPWFATGVEMPFFKDIILNLGFFYILFVICILIGSTNAVNLTDGLDGLAIGCLVMVALTFIGFSYISGHSIFARYLNVFYIPGSGELSVFCSALMGAGLGFLWFNSYPASIFMGDTGALALGGAIGIVSVIVKKEMILFLVGGIYVIEALSVILQVGTYKLTGKRLFRMSPLHHHLQLKGWPETKITIRFWIVSIILALVSLATLKLR